MKIAHSYIWPARKLLKNSLIPGTNTFLGKAKSAKDFYNFNVCLRLVVVSAIGSKDKSSRGFPGGAVVKNPPASAGDTGSSPGPGRSHVPRSN